VHRSVLRPALAVSLAAAVTGATATDAAASTAPATTTATTSTPADFYAAPAPLPAGKPGALIRYRPTTANLGAGAPATSAWTVMYHSRTAQGNDEAVTGTVLEPTAGWSGAGPRPYVTFAAGTQGLGPSCAPSKQLVAGTEYEASSISLALNKGWGVVVTDYDGYTTGATPTYTAGPDMAHAVLDIARAARQVPGVDEAAGAPLAAWGYSQGGGGSAWASVLQPTYAPELNLLADASGGVPADPKAVGDSLNANAGAAFLLDALIGNQVAYPKQWQFTPLLNPAGIAAVATIKQQCVSDSLTTFAFKDLNTYLTPGHTLAQFEATPGVTAVTAANQLAAQPAPRVPVYQYHSAADEIVPLAQATALHQKWCTEGVRTRMDLYPGDHVTGDSEGAPAAVRWIDEVFSGRPILTACLS